MPDLTSEMNDDGAEDIASILGVGSAVEVALGVASASEGLAGGSRGVASRSQGVVSGSRGSLGRGGPSGSRGSLGRGSRIVATGSRGGGKTSRPLGEEAQRRRSKRTRIENTENPSDDSLNNSTDTSIIDDAVSVYDSETEKYQFNLRRVEVIWSWRLNLKMRKRKMFLRG